MLFLELTTRALASVVPFFFRVPENKPIQYYLDPSCPRSVVRGMNEARWVAGNLNNILRFQLGVTELAPALDWTFATDPKHKEHLQDIANKYFKITLMERSWDPHVEGVHIFCNNQTDWTPINPGGVFTQDGGARWDLAETEKYQNRTFWVRRPTMMVEPGSRLACRHEPRQAPAFTFRERRNRVRIDLCGNTSTRPGTTSDVLEDYKSTLPSPDKQHLGQIFSHAHRMDELIPISGVLLHELIHVPWICHRKKDKICGGCHAVRNKRVSGSISQPTCEAPGWKLGSFKHTRYNPDSYVWLAMYYQFRRMGHRMQLTDDKLISLEHYQPPVHLSGMLDWQVTGEGKPIGNGSPWAELGPNWTDDPTKDMEKVNAEPRNVNHGEL